MTTNLFILLAVAAGVLYRMGGSGKWDTKWRDVGVPLVTLTAMWVLHQYHWSLWLCLPLMWAALTTYWKVLNKFFGKPTTDCFWFNWLAHGVVIGLAFIPYGLMTHTMWLVIGRAVVIGLAMMVWSEVNDDVVWEENGRGQACVWTLLLCLIR